MINKLIENMTAKELIAFARANGVSVGSLVRTGPISDMFNGLSSVDALDEGLITEGLFAEYHGVNRLEARHLAESMRNPPNLYDTPTEEIKASLRRSLEDVKEGRVKPISELWQRIDTEKTQLH